MSAHRWSECQRLFAFGFCEAPVPVAGQFWYSPGGSLGGGIEHVSMADLGRGDWSHGRRVDSCDGSGGAVVTARKPAQIFLRQLVAAIGLPGEIAFAQGWPPFLTDL